MEPSASNTRQPGCSPVSSNCVVWQGPDVKCLQICKGDSVSDVTFKLAQQVCAFREAINLSDLDLQCLISACGNCSTPNTSLKAVLQMIITQVCTGTAGSGPTPPPYTLPNINLAQCFQSEDANGNPVTQLPLDQYVYQIGVMVCQQVTALNQLTAITTSNTTRITALENRTPPTFTIPQITPTCSGPQVLTNVDVALTQLEVLYCSVSAALGGSTASAVGANLLAAAGKQCTNLNTASSFSSPGSAMSTLPGWKATIGSVADSLNNMWLTICDLRAGVTAALACCPSGCSLTTIGYTVVLSGSGPTLSAKVLLYGLSTIPSAFNDCASPDGSVLVITDASGNSYSYPINVAQTATNPSGISIPLSNTPLSTTSATYTFTLNSCLTNGTSTCSKTTIVNVTNVVTCNPVTSASATLT
jgi:hypothetical protein